MNPQRVLVTGHRGLVGRALASRLAEAGTEVVGFDLLDGQDVRDGDAVLSAARGCDAVVHLAALVDPSLRSSEVAAVNVGGTRNVLQAAEAVGAGRVVFVSSVNVLGVFRGEAPPDYLPVDDDHPCRPRSLYGKSKLEAERLCRAFTKRTGIPTVCLRPPAIWDEAAFRFIHRRRREDPSFEWSPGWEYGAFLDVRDCARACTVAFESGVEGHVTALLCAADLSTSGPTARAWAARLLPGVPWRGGVEAFEGDPYRALLDTRVAREQLGFTPRHTWRAWVEAAAAEDAEDAGV